jgi:hypothetical protein
LMPDIYLEADTFRGDEKDYYSKINGLWVRMESYGIFGCMIYDTRVRTYGGDIVYTPSQARGNAIEVYIKYDNNPIGPRLCVWDWQYDVSVAEKVICPLSNQSFIHEYTHQLTVNNITVSVLKFYSFYNNELKRNQVRLINVRNEHQLIYTSVVEGLPSQLPPTTWSFFEHKRLKVEPTGTPQPYVPGLLGCMNLQLLANTGQWIKPEWGQTEVVPPDQNHPDFSLVVTQSDGWAAKKIHLPN